MHKNLEKQGRMGGAGFWERLIFGEVYFLDSEEYLRFQFRFLAIIILCSAFLTAIFILASSFSVNKINPDHVRSMVIFTLASVSLWLLMRGRKERFLPIAWIYEIICLLESLSSLVFVPEDDLRVFWFVINIPGVFLVLGSAAGWAITLLVITVFLVANPHIEARYSDNALATYSLGMIYFAVFMHVYVSRSLSYFNRMRESNEKLAYMASHDPLTGVLNARAYYEACNGLIEHATRHGRPYSVLFVDLDHFKSINDKHGHAVGDLVLKAVASALASGIRRSDVLGRIGGEEFSVFLPDTPLKGALTLAEMLRQVIESLMPTLHDGSTLRITASIGLAENDPAHVSMLDIQQQADQAMYLAKAQGRNRVSALTSSVT